MVGGEEGSYERGEAGAATKRIPGPKLAGGRSSVCLSFSCTCVFVDSSDSVRYSVQRGTNEGINDEN